MPAEPPGATTDAIEQLHRAGWSIGITAWTNGAGEGPTWIVSGSNGENQIRAEGATAAEAWQATLGQARGQGMLERIKPGEPLAG